MRVLMTTTGHSGHVLPLAPVGQALLRAGHEVRVASQPSRRENVERTGLPFEPLADYSANAMTRAIEAARRYTPEQANRPVIRDGFAGVGTPALLPPLLYLVDEWRPDLIVRESYEFAGALVAERHDIPHARVGLGLAAVEEAVIAAAAPRVDQIGREIGLAPDREGTRLRSEPWLSTFPSLLDPAPTGPGVERPVRFRSAPDDVRIESLPNWWPGTSGPLVYLSFGSVAGSLPLFPGLYREAIAALAGLPARVLVTTGTDGDPSELGDLPANVHVERWIPQERMLPLASVVIGHGGHGSTLGALFHGVPAVLVPLFAGDQWANARRVAEAGAGIALTGAGPRKMADPPGPDVIDALPRAVERLIEDPSYRHTAERIAAAAHALPSAGAAIAALPIRSPQEALT